MRGMAMVAAVAAFGGMASAEPVDVRTAAGMLFPARGANTVIRPEAGLSEIDQKTLKVLFSQQNFPFYGAVAISPGDGLVAEPTNLAQNLHSPEAAGAAALAACNRLRKADTPCIIAAEVLPKGWEPRPLMLNRDATEGLRKVYRPGKGPKAMAISASTGVWSVAKGVGAGVAAMRECARQAEPLGATDCEVVIAD